MPNTTKYALKRQKMPLKRPKTYKNPYPLWLTPPLTAVQLVFNPFSQLVPQLELYSQLQLSLWSDPIAGSVPKPT